MKRKKNNSLVATAIFFALLTVICFFAWNKFNSTNTQREVVANLFKSSELLGIVGNRLRQSNFKGTDLIDIRLLELESSPFSDSFGYTAYNVGEKEHINLLTQLFSESLREQDHENEIYVRIFFENGMEREIYAFLVTQDDVRYADPFLK